VFTFPDDGGMQAVSHHHIHRLSARYMLQKPYFATMLMFVGELVCLIMYKISADKRNKQTEGLLSDDAFSSELNDDELAMGVVNAASSPSSGSGRVAKTRPPWYFFLGFCSFDLTATLISGIGLLWVDSSLYQMLRGGTVVFAALVSKLLLGQKFSKRQLVGLACVVSGLIIVGAAGLLRQAYDKDPLPIGKVSAEDEPPSKGKVAFGMALIVACR
jgi:hypothetical protein